MQKVLEVDSLVIPQAEVAAIRTLSKLGMRHDLRHPLHVMRVHFVVT